MVHPSKGMSNPALKYLLDAGVLAPGPDVLSGLFKGVSVTAGLRSDGCIVWQVCAPSFHPQLSNLHVALGNFLVTFRQLQNACLYRADTHVLLRSTVASSTS